MIQKNITSKMSSKVPRSSRGMTAGSILYFRLIFGFTFVEILITLLIVSISLMFAIPNWREFKEANHTTTAIKHLASLFYYAHNEAIKRGQVVTICPSADQKICGGQWQNGQLVIANSSIIYRYNQPDVNGYWRMQTFGNAPYLSILPLGELSQQNSSLVYCPNNHDAHYAKAIFINKSGRVRVSQDADHDGIDEDAEGRPLSCT